MPRHRPAIVCRPCTIESVRPRCKQSGVGPGGDLPGMRSQTGQVSLQVLQQCDKNLRGIVRPAGQVDERGGPSLQLRGGICQWVVGVNANAHDLPPVGQPFNENSGQLSLVGENVVGPMQADRPARQERGQSLYDGQANRQRHKRRAVLSAAGHLSRRDRQAQGQAAGAGPPAIAPPPPSLGLPVGDDQQRHLAHHFC